MFPFFHTHLTQGKLKGTDFIDYLRIKFTDIKATIYYEHVLCKIVDRQHALLDCETEITPT